MLDSPNERTPISVEAFDELNARSWDVNAALWSAAGAATPLRDAMLAEVDVAVGREVAAMGGSADLVDLGCADGHYLRRLRQSGFTGNLFGVDQCPALAARSRAACPSADVTVADLNLELSPFVKDAAIATCLLTLVEMAKPERALRNAAAMLRSGGLLVATVLDPTVEALRYVGLKRGRPGTALYDVAGEIAIGSTFEVQGELSGAPYFRFLRPLDLYLSALMAASFELESLNAVQDVDFPFQLQARAVTICARKQSGERRHGR